MRNITGKLQVYSAPAVHKMIEGELTLFVGKQQKLTNKVVSRWESGAFGFPSCCRLLLSGRFPCQIWLEKGDEF